MKNNIRTGSTPVLPILDCCLSQAGGVMVALGSPKAQIGVQVPTCLLCVQSQTVRHATATRTKLVQLQLDALLKGDSI